MKTVKLKICNEHGDTQKEVTQTAAVEEIINEHFKNGRWVYVGSNAVSFTASNPTDSKLAADRAEISKLLDDMENPMVIMTGDLVGGATKSKTKCKSRSATAEGTNAKSLSSGRYPTSCKKVGCVKNDATGRPIIQFGYKPAYLPEGFETKDLGASTSLNFGSGSSVTLTRGPLSKVFNSHRTPQLAVSVQMIGGQETVNVMVTDYKGSLARLKRHLGFISASINEVLDDEVVTRAYMPGSRIF